MFRVVGGKVIEMRGKAIVPVEVATPGVNVGVTVKGVETYSKADNATYCQYSVVRVVFT